MKVLHSADLHLDTPFTGRSPEQAAYLRQALLSLPQQLTDLCHREQCDLMLLSGDLFDGPATKESLDALRFALKEAGVPVFIAPGNHDFVSATSPYLTESWPSNVHIFTRPSMQSITLQELDCKIYGAGFQSMDCPGLLNGFQAEGSERFHIGVLHADPTNAASPCCPVTEAQLRESGLHYLALGHIHKVGSIVAGETLCAWPGCPMGRGFDELGPKGVLIVTLDEADTDVKQVPLNTPAFFDLETTVEDLPNCLSPQGNQDFYRVTLVGDGHSPTTEELYAQYAHFPHLQFRDRRSNATDLWDHISADTLEGAYFRLLKDAISDADPDTRELITLAAQISRQLLDGKEVKLP